jgi:HK97 family phage portal protein
VRNPLNLLFRRRPPTPPPGPAAASDGTWYPAAVQAREAGRRRFRTEVRAITGVPWDQGGTFGSAMTVDRALSLVPVYAAARLLASSVASLPLHTYRKASEDERVRLPMPPLFKHPSADGTLYDWLHRLVTSLALRGNAYGLIVAREPHLLYPTQIEWVDPAEVYVNEIDPRQPYSIAGHTVPREDLLHIPWFTLPGRIEGLSPIGAYQATVNQGLAAQDYASGWFNSGGIPPGTFKNAETTIEQEEAEEIKGRLVRAIRSREPIVYGRDWDYQPITIPPGESQFVETLQLTATQVAAIYGIWPEMIGGTSGESMTYANVEGRQLDFAMLCLRPWLVKLEHALSPLLPGLQYVRFQIDAMIRADLRSRHEVYAIDRKIGLRSIDEMRALEDLPPLPDGKGSDPSPLQAAPSPAPAPADPAPTSAPAGPK